MNRSRQLRAAILRIVPFGETHASVDLLTAEEGLVPAVAWGLGARRSSLRGRVVPFARGTVWLYRDPRQERAKITDMQVDRYALSASEDLGRYYHASLWAEIASRSLAAGGDPGAADGADAWHLMDEALDLLEVREVEVKRISLLFLWRYLGLLGVQADPDSSVVTGRPFREGETRYFDRREGGFVGVTRAPAGAAALGAGAARLLARALSEPLSDLVRIDIGDGEQRALFAALIGAIEEAIGRDLNTVKVAGRALV